MSEFQPFPGAALDRCGLNRHAVFDLADLPDEVVDSIVGGTTGYRQLMLIGHGGRALWESVKKSGGAGADPIDDFTVRTIRQWMSESLPDKRYAILYPGSDTIDAATTRRAGRLASCLAFHGRHRRRMGHLVRLPRGRAGRYAFCALAKRHGAQVSISIIPVPPARPGRASPPALLQPWPTAHFPCKNASPGASRPTRHAPSPAWRGSPARSAALTAIALNNWPIPIRFRCRRSGNITE